MATLGHYTQLLYYIKSLGESGSYINTITRGNEIDLDKGNIFPLFNIVVDSGSFTNGQTLVFNVELELVALRDVNKQETNTDKFWLNDNEVDNHNETHAELNRIWLLMLEDFEKNNIIASENPALTKITNEGKNNYDGWSLSFDVTMPNNVINLCDGCG